MEAYGSGCIDRNFLTSALVGGEWSTSRPGHFTPGERAPGTHWIGASRSWNIFTETNTAEIHAGYLICFPSKGKPSLTTVYHCIKP
jgi:hypothetical protein